MLRVAIDTNVFVGAISEKSPYYKIYQAWLNGEFEICVTNEILLEYEEIIGRIYGDKILNLFLKLIITSPFVTFTSPTFRFNLIIDDYDDNKFVDCALVSSADYIITSDKHFNILDRIEFPKISIITPKAFIQKFLII